MTRTRLGLFSLLLAANTWMACGTESEGLTSRPPNVVILVADDLGFADVGYRGSAIQTPGIDRLAAEGLRLERFYATPICTPTRAALMTGRDPLLLGLAYDQIHPWYNAGLAPDQETLPRAFQSAGYQTALVGKWHLGLAKQAFSALQSLTIDVGTGYASLTTSRRQRRLVDTRGSLEP